MKLSGLVLAALAFLLAGCAATGPVSSPEYPSLVQASMPPEAGKVVMFGPGEWFPNTIGFTDIRSTGGYLATTPISCVIAFSDNAVVVEQWDDKNKKFNVMKLIRMPDVVEANVDTFLSSSRLVLKSADYSYNSFDFTSGEFLDAAKTRQVAAFLQERIARRGVKE